MHDIMFENQKALGVPELEKYAQQIGLDVDQFKADLSSDKFAKTVKADMAGVKRSASAAHRASTSTAANITQAEATP